MDRVESQIDDPGAVGREVLEFVDVGGVPDVGAADHDVGEVLPEALATDLPDAFGVDVLAVFGVALPAA